MCSALVAGDEAAVPGRRHRALLLRLQPHGLLHAEVLHRVAHAQIHHLPEGARLTVTWALGEAKKMPTHPQEPTQTRTEIVILGTGPKH